MSVPPASRRGFLAQGAGLLGTALAALQAREARAQQHAVVAPDFAPRAKRAVWLFMGGGPSQLDLFDYKPELRDRFNQELPASVRGEQRLTGMTADQERFPVAPSLFGFQQAGQSGAWVSELLPWTARVVDQLAIVRSVSTEAINHEPALLSISTGTQQPGKPSLGAWLSYGLGNASDDLPTYVVMNSRFSRTAFPQPVPPRVWGSGFLPATHAGVPLRSSGDPVLYLKDPAGLDKSSRRRMLDALARLNDLHFQALGSPESLARTAQYELAFRMQSALPALADMSGESAATLGLYGEDASTPGTFAANCLAARRMLERGVRFVQVFHRGWDAHYETPRNHRAQCSDVDRGCYALITDLEQRGMLQDTLVIWGGEFGRTVYSQGQLSREDYGRDHHPRCFSMWLAGGGVRGGMVHGRTDDFSYNVVEGEVPLRDLHATILYLFGLDAQRLSVPQSGLAERLVGTGPAARVVKALLG